MLSGKTTTGLDESTMGACEVQTAVIYQGAAFTLGTTLLLSGVDFVVFIVFCFRFVLSMI